jgi:uncharacterized membrane protein
LPASYLKGHFSFEKWLAGEQSVFADSFCNAYLALGGIHSCMGFPMSTLWPLGSIAKGQNFGCKT